MHHVPYSIDTFKPIDAIVPGNSTADNPLEFDIVPPWGPDLARLKSVILAATGLVEESGWTPEVQAAVIAAFDTGASAFTNTVTAIRGLTIPARMALRAGVIREIPPGGNMDTPVPIVSGQQFSSIAGAVGGLALHVAFALVNLAGKQDIDARFFVQPSGSGGPGTPKAKRSTAGNARPASRRRETAAGPTGPTNPPAGT